MGPLWSMNNFTIRCNIWFDFGIILLKTNSTTMQNALVGFFPPEERVQSFLDLNGMFLSTRSLAKQMTGETPDILTFELDQVKEHSHAAAVDNREKGNVRNRSEAWLNTLQVTPMLDP